MASKARAACTCDALPKRESSRQLVIRGPSSTWTGLRHAQEAVTMAGGRHERRLGSPSLRWPASYRRALGLSCVEPLPTTRWAPRTRRPTIAGLSTRKPSLKSCTATMMVRRREQPRSSLLTHHSRRWLLLGRHRRDHRLLHPRSPRGRRDRLATSASCGADGLDADVVR